MLNFDCLPACGPARPGLRMDRNAGWAGWGTPDGSRMVSNCPVLCGCFELMSWLSVTTSSLDHEAKGCLVIKWLRHSADPETGRAYVPASSAPTVDEGWGPPISPNLSGFTGQAGLAHGLSIKVRGWGAGLASQ